ncbi:MAG: energy transducer TonB, partial [Acidobacteria bacterium]|nr:energy transducer TonB [Acidobacteriota bacterium]
SKLAAPSRVPDRVADVVDEAGGPPALAGDGRMYSGPSSGIGGTVEGGLDYGSRSVIPLPPAERAVPMKTDTAATARIERIRLGGAVLEGKLVRKVMPVYPALARAARISGVVRLRGIVGTDGSIRNLEVVSGHPLLVEAAADAVRQWAYRPTMLNGMPVEVIAPIEVTFRLSQ